MKNGKMYENMQKCLKICKHLSKYASTHQNMQKICKNPKYATKNFLVFSRFIGFWKF